MPQYTLYASTKSGNQIIIAVTADSRQKAEAFFNHYPQSHAFTHSRIEEAMDPSETTIMQEVMLDRTPIHALYNDGTYLRGLLSLGLNCSFEVVFVPLDETGQTFDPDRVLASTHPVLASVLSHPTRSVIVPGHKGKWIPVITSPQIEL